MRAVIARRGLDLVIFERHICLRHLIHVGHTKYAEGTRLYFIFHISALFMYVLCSNFAYNG